MLNKASVSEAIGEYAALAELLRRGFTAFLAHGRTQPDWDIIVYPEEGAPVKVQVKAVGHQSSVHINTDKILFDVLVIVDTRLSTKDQDQNTPMRFFVLKDNEVPLVLSAENTEKKGKPEDRYISVPRTVTGGVFLGAHNAWSKISGA